MPPKRRGRKPKTVQTGENAGNNDPPHIETPLSTEDVIRIVADQLKTAFPNRHTGTNESGSHHGPILVEGVMANNENNYVVRRIPLVVLSDSDTDPSEHSDNSDDNETMATNEHPSQNQEQEARQTRPFPLGGDSGPSTPAVERGESSHGINVSDFVSRRAFDKWRSVHQQECNLVAHQAQELTDNWGELEETVIINDMGLAAVREEIQRGKKWVMAAAALTWVTMIRIAAFIYVFM
ncbi:hypothetical protein R6Q59_006142 [Mikania micrantha]